LKSPAGRCLPSIVEQVSVVRRPARRGAPGTEQISLLVQGNMHDAPAGVYRIETDDVGLGELYFSPVDGTGQGRRLEAVINRIV
jgi:hypothetical protein